MATGIVSTYDLTAGVIVSIDEFIAQLDPLDTPLQGGVGADGRTVLAQRNDIREKKHEWQDETILIPSSTAAEAIDSSETGIDVASGDGLKFQTGSTILVNAEQMYVTSVSTDTLTVTRAFNGTSAASHSSGVVIIDLGISLPEGSDPEPARSKDWTNRFNYMQIFGPDAVQVSGTEQAVAKYGLTTTQFDHQAMNRAAENKIRLEHALLYGTRRDGSSDAIRQMGGMIYWITTNVDSSTTTITAAKLLDQMQAGWDLGGSMNKALMGSKQKRVISAIDSDDIRLGRTDMGRGQVVDWYDSDFGRVDMILHRRVRVQDLFLFSRDQATILTLRPWQFEMLAKTGDSIKGQIVGEKSLKFEKQRYAARFSALT